MCNDVCIQNYKNVSGNTVITIVTKLKYESKIIFMTDGSGAITVPIDRYQQPSFERQRII